VLAALYVFFRFTPGRLAMSRRSAKPVSSAWSGSGGLDARLGWGLAAASAPSPAS